MLHLIKINYIPQVSNSYKKSNVVAFYKIKLPWTKDCPRFPLCERKRVIFCNRQAE